MRPYYEQDGVTIFHGDCRDVLPSLVCDVVVTDPPYGTGGWRRLEAGAGSNPSGSLVQEAWDDGATDWLRLCDPRAAFVFWPPARIRLLLDAADACGLTKHRTLYMRKPDPKPLPGGRTKWSVEPVWVLSRDGFVLFGGDDMYEHSTPRRGQAVSTGHPYQKPLKVMTWLLSKTDAPCVVDPFMGSGTTLVAAKQLGKRAIGIEAEERWCEAAANRLAQGVLSLMESPA